MSRNRTLAALALATTAALASPPAGAASALWRPALPLNAPRSVHAFAGGTAYVVDLEVPDQVVLWASTDAGATWTRRPMPPVHHVAMATPRVGYAASLGSGSAVPAVYRTLDGGRIWQPLDVPLGSHRYYYVNGIVSSDDGMTVAVATENRDEAQTCGGESLPTTQVYVSNDAGESWHYRPLPVTGGVVRAGDFLDSRTGALIVSSGRLDGACVYQDTAATLWVTRNGGRSYELANACPLGCDDVQFLPSGRLVVSTGRREFAISDDGGRSWHTGRLPADGTSGTTRIDFADASVGYAATWLGTRAGKVYRTEDGGETWTLEPVPASAVAAMGRTSAVALGDRFGYVRVG